ncbi:hypothetical protein M9H77_13982 [Catharanthus roseus]|uniref:Uncharacterized protein n=1 Tax=Catharanthus roseus TaxID=4058 RepID=A0ACC0BLZ9_CATRO|nr:hypothetical protein M9H77_13982 [Catharanthus roseus]
MRREHIENEVSKETSTGEIIERISGDTILVQDAIVEKRWQLSLVLISSIQPLVLAASAMTMFITKLASRAQTVYSIAAILVEQTLSSIRTGWVMEFSCLCFSAAKCVRDVVRSKNCYGKNLLINPVIKYKLPIYYYNCSRKTNLS